MPSVYVLKKKDGRMSLKGNKQFIRVDEELCEHFGVEPHDVNWYQNWENNIGVFLATGKTFQEILEHDWLDDDQKAAIRWIEANYDVDAWAEVGRSR